MCKSDVFSGSANRKTFRNTTLLLWSKCTQQSSQKECTAVNPVTTFLCLYTKVGTIKTADTISISFFFLMFQLWVQNTFFYIQLRGV